MALHLLYVHISDPAPSMSEPAGNHNGAMDDKAFEEMRRMLVEALEAKKPTEPSVKELVDAYLSDRRPHLAKGTFGDHQRVLDRFMLEFGQRQPASIKPSDFRTWINSQEEWKKANTRWCRANVIQALFNWAVNDNRIARNPIKAVRIKKGGRRRMTSPAEYVLMARRDCYFRPCVIFLRWSGQRPQDMRRLEYEWITWQNGMPYKAVIPPGRHKTGSTTGAAKVILFHPRAARLIYRCWQRSATKSGRVFLNSFGEAWSREALGQRLAAIREATGIPKQATFHGLRHLFATQWLARGGSKELLAAFLGHKGTRMIDEFYAHPEEMETEILDEAKRVMGPKKRGNPGNR